MSSNTTKRLPGNISFARYKLGLSQQQLADMLGVSRSFVAMVETGKRKFSGPVATVYNEMCRSAAMMNPGGCITIKRGRKPASNPICVVTNYDNPVEKESNEGFFERLRQKKTKLNYLHRGLQFKKRKAEEQNRHFSDQKKYVTAMLNTYASLLNQLPEGKLRDKYELRAAVLHAKQIKLKQQLKKCGAVALLQIDYQLKVLEQQIGLAEETITGLNNEQQPSINVMQNTVDARGIAA